MTIDIGDISVSIPTAISNWAKESEDNRTEFDGMIDSIMYAVKKFYKEKYKPNPYQELYEKQVKECLLKGRTKEQADQLIKNMIDGVEKKDNEIQLSDEASQLLGLLLNYFT